jgi:cell division septation protein DedD
MPEEPVSDDQSHYEISLTAGQAFIAFVLLLLSLAASFAFGLLIGKGQSDDRLIVKKEPAVVTEASMTPKKSDTGRIVELGVASDDFKPPVKSDATTTTTAPPPVVTETTATGTTATTASTATVTQPPPVPATPVIAQLLSTSDQKTAEALAVQLINAGFTTARVEKGTTDKGTIFRVRIPFNSESEARAAEAKLHEFSKDVWITK